MVNDLNKLAILLKGAAEQTISEETFWAEFNALSKQTKNPIIDIALESATHYWGNFHRRSIFFFIPCKPNPGQLLQGKNELNLIADALEHRWDLPLLEKRLKNI